MGISGFSVFPFPAKDSYIRHHRSLQRMERYSNLAAPAPEDYRYLERCVELAEEAFAAGDKPFGSVLVNAEGKIIAEARNRVNEKNALAHPEFELAKWAVENLSPEKRKQTRMYTSGEHCPMCAGAHAWAGLGDLIFLSSAKQLNEWLKKEGATESPIQFVPSSKIINHITIKGPGEGSLLERIKNLQLSNVRRSKQAGN